MPTFVAASTPSFRPSSSDLPGTDVLEHLADGIFFWALIACGLGVVIGGVMWAFGHYSGNGYVPTPKGPEGSAGV